ncbi:hypothetical protein Tco_0163400 [Tanacetum coccineum]
MKESSNPTQIPPQQEQNPQQEQQPESLIPFKPSTQVLFDIDDIIFNDNNEVALLYPPYTNQDYFIVVSDFISKCCLREAFTRTPNQYKEYQTEFWRSRSYYLQECHWANYLSQSTEYADVPSLETIRAWFSTTWYSGEIGDKGTLKKSCLPPRRRLLMAKIIQCLGEHKMEGYGNDNVTLNPTQVFSVHKWALKKNQAEGPPFTDHMLDICNAKEPVSFKAPKTSSKAEKKSKIEITKGVSFKKGDTGSQTGHLIKETQSSSSMDSNPIQPSASTLVVSELHKEDQQETGGPTSLGSPMKKEPILSSVVVSSSKAGADSGVSAPKDLISQTTCNDEGLNKLSLDHIFEGKGASDIAKKIEEEFNTSPDLSGSNDTQKDIKLNDLSKLVSDVWVNFMDLNSPKDDEPIIVQDDSDEEVHAEKVQTEEPKETTDALAPHPPSLKSIQIQKLTNQVLFLQSQNSNLNKEKTKAKDEVALFLTQPSYPNVALMTELLVKSFIATQVAKLKTLQRELLAEFLSVPTQFVSIQAKIKTLDALLILLNKVTDALNKFA